MNTLVFWRSPEVPGFCPSYGVVFTICTSSGLPPWINPNSPPKRRTGFSAWATPDGNLAPSAEAGASLRSPIP
eukprot:7086748-Pyramimonas_sp.AAC.1